jgi:hypothetical protein
MIVDGDELRRVTPCLLVRRKTEMISKPVTIAPPSPRRRKALRGGVDADVEGRRSAPFGLCGQRFAKSRRRLARDEARDVVGRSARCDRRLSLSFSENSGRVPSWLDSGTRHRNELAIANSTGFDSRSE